MKKLVTLALLMTALLSSSLYAQKNDQSQLYNEFYLGYGIGSVYYFVNNIDHHYPMDSYYYYDYDQTDISLTGPLFAGFDRKLTKTVTVGFNVSYMTRTTKAYYYDYTVGPPYPITGTQDFEDHLFTAISRVKFTYLNKPYFSMYSGVGIGVTIDWGHTNENGTTYKDHKLMPAGQATLMGIRVGRALAGFAEFGVGTTGIITGGISYKFGKE